MGDGIAVETTLKAKHLLFSEKDVPTHEERLAYFERTDILNKPEISKILTALDAAFVKNYEEELADRLTKFALENGFWEED
mgnify:CR=1 FL=1